MEFKEIGTIKSDLKFKGESPTQGTYVSFGEAEVHLNPGFDFEQALEGIEEFERIWLIYRFHKNDNWKPKVNVPRLKDEKKGVFATRSPYRPNAIGMTCVKLKEVSGRVLKVEESDLLDGSPILDIKPYVNYSDSFDSAQPSWLEKAESESYQIIIPEYLDKKIHYAEKVAKLSFFQFINTQLQFEPLNTDRKRIKLLKKEDSGEQAARISFRTWRIEYSVNPQKKSVFLMDLFSGYSKDDLEDLRDDPYGDKKAHLKFKAKFK